MSALSITARGRTLHFFFDTKAWAQIEREFGSLETMYDLIDGNENPLDHTLRMTALIANAGARQRQEPEEVTPEWLLENLTPKKIRKAGTLAKLAIMAGWKREEVDDEDEGPVDVVLEEQQKKTEND